jgi:uncharacterized MAPEG superfamily protein
MTPAVITVIVFALWTLVVLLAGVGVRRWYLILCKQTPLTCFPADVAHGSPAYRRAMRAHVNCVENLPVYAAIVLTSEIYHSGSAVITPLSIVFILCRVTQSCVHLLFPETNATVGLRFGFFITQIVIMIWMAIAALPIG